MNPFTEKNDTQYLVADDIDEVRRAFANVYDVVKAKQTLSDEDCARNLAIMVTKLEEAKDRAYQVITRLK